MASTARICKATNKTGKPCQGHCLPSGDFCLFHDPTRAADRAESRRKGGKARHGRQVGTVGDKPSALTTLGNVADVLAVVEYAINSTMILENSNQRNRTLGTLAMAALKAFEISEIEQRLIALEQMMKERKTA